MSTARPPPQPVNDALVAFAGRTFSRFAVTNHLHCVPVDEQEEQLSDELNRIIRELLGRTVVPQFSLNDIDEPAALDCGSGKGAWIDMLMGEYDDVDVTGVDIFFGSGNSDSDEDDAESSGSEEGAVEEYVKKRWNLNAPFRLDRSNSRLRPESFDLINSRFLLDGIDTPRWQGYVQELRHLLRPGGWLQMVELHLLFQSNSGHDVPYLQTWWRWYANMLETMHKDVRVGNRLQMMMQMAAFENIAYRVVRLPVGDWQNPHRQLGVDAAALFKKIIRSWSVWPFLRHPGDMTPDRYTNLLRGAEAELDNSRLKLYINVYVTAKRRSMMQHLTRQ